MDGRLSLLDALVHVRVGHVEGADLGLDVDLPLDPRLCEILASLLERRADPVGEARQLGVQLPGAAFEPVLLGRVLAERGAGLLGLAVDLPDRLLDDGDGIRLLGPIDRRVSDPCHQTADTGQNAFISHGLLLCWTNEWFDADHDLETRIGWNEAGGGGPAPALQVAGHVVMHGHAALDGGKVQHCRPFDRVELFVEGDARQFLP